MLLQYTSGNIKSWLEDYLIRLSKFRESRNIQTEQQLGNLHNTLEEEAEELKVGMKDNNLYEMIDALCDICVYILNCISPDNKDYIDNFTNRINFCLNNLQSTEHDTRDNHLQRFLLNLKVTTDYLRNSKISNKKSVVSITVSEAFAVMYKVLKVDPLKAMDEVFMEINSRIQDPKQKERWDRGDIKSDEKWKKDVNQDPNTKYKAKLLDCVYIK